MSSLSQSPVSPWDYILHAKKAGAHPGGVAAAAASPAPLDLIAAKAKLRKTETKVKPHPTVDELGQIKAANPELLKFYEKVLITAESERQALKKEVVLKVGHIASQVSDNVS